MAPRIRLAGRLGAALVVGALAAGCPLVVARHRGLAAGLAGQLRHAGLEESRNQWRSMLYMVPRFEQLTFDPASGRWDFRLTPERGLDRFQRGVLAFHRGDFLAASGLLEAELAERGESEARLFWLALAHMRRGEVASCLELLGGDSPAALAETAGATAEHGPLHPGHPVATAELCSLPLRRPHRDPEPARRAAVLLVRLLDRYGAGDADGVLYRWLLNLDLMTAGGFPQQVPPRYLLRTRFIDAYYGAAAERRRRRHADLRFVDRARQLGVLNPGTGRGVAVEDFDGDGDLDLVATGSFGGLRYYRNEAGRRFTDATAGSGLESVRQPLTVSPVDFDGDGAMDLFVVCPYTHYRLLANRGGRFHDVTRQSGLLDAVPDGTLAASWIGAWGDVDRDGSLDLFLTSWAQRWPLARGLPALPRLDSKLFLNHGGRFRDVTAEYGLAAPVRDRLLVAAAFGDYDRDGWPDLYYAGPFPGSARLLRNVRGRRFVTQPLDWHEPGFTAAFLDIDHDGRLDLFHGGYADARSAVRQAVLDEPPLRSGHSAILRQQPDGRFVAQPEAFASGAGSMGSSYGDLDNDGCFDFYLGTGGPEPWFVLPNQMFRGRRRGTGCSGGFDDVSVLAGFANLQKGHGIAFFDFDGDGDQDVYSSLGGMWPGDPWVSQLFVNESTGGGAWVKLRLRGRRSNRFGVGSYLRIHAVAGDGAELVRSYLLDGKTGFGAGPFLAHVGLATAQRIERVEVTWSGSGCVGSYPARLGELAVLDEADCLAARARDGGGPGSPR